MMRFHGLARFARRTSCVLSMLGVAIGQKFGAKYQDRATLIGGIVLVLIGLRILLEHLGVFG